MVRSALERIGNVYGYQRMLHTDKAELHENAPTGKVTVIGCRRIHPDGPHITASSCGD